MSKRPQGVKDGPSLTFIITKYRCDEVLRHATYGMLSLLRPSSDAMCCDQCVCFSVCPLAYLKNYSTNFTRLSVHVTCGREPVTEMR